MASLKVISADSHMMEPPDLWTQRLDHKFKERAPKVVTQDAGSRPLFVAPGLKPYPISVAFAAGRSGNELREFIGKAGAQDAERYRDPGRRIEDQDRDGVSAEVLYTTLGMSLFGWRTRNCRPPASSRTTIGRRSSAHTTPSGFSGWRWFRWPISSRARRRFGGREKSGCAAR